MSTEFTNDRDSNGANKPGKMPSDLIRILVENYRRNHLSAINSTLSMEDAHSIWFDLPKLKKFINLVESEARAVNPDVLEEDLGIRFYYAAYPKIEDWDIMNTHPVSKDYAGKHTLVMLPTLKEQNENGEFLNNDFNSLFDGSQNEIQRKGKSPGESLAENQGALFPPGNPFHEGF